MSTVKLPPRSPALNAFAERIVRSVKQECLRKVIPLDEARLRKIVTEYVAHYHLERNHEGLGNELIEPTNAHRRAVSAARGSAGRAGITIARRHDFQATEFRHLAGRCSRASSLAAIAPVGPQ